MEIEYKLTVEDLVALVKYNADHSPGPPLAYRGGLWLLALMCLLIVVLCVVAGGEEHGSPHLWFFSAGLLFVLWLLFFQRPLSRMMIGHHVRQSLKDAESARIRETQRLTIAPDGVKAADSLSTLFTTWAGVPKVAATEERAFIYISPKLAHIIPKRAFGSDKAFLDFVEAAKRYHGAVPG